MEITDELSTPSAAHLVLGRYRIGARLGSGGFGSVHAAVDERLQRPVAVKIVANGGRGGAGGERARREALAAGRLDHPAIVAIYDAGEDEHARYLISELVHGATLDRLCADGVLTDRDVVRIGLALCGALEHAHARGVVHRDVKPQNVIVPEAPRSAAGVAKLTDFGIARLAGDDPLTATGDVVGTLAYMAPEQAAGEHVDERADVYSLALVLYEALAGVNPVRAGSPAATARRVGTPLPSLARTRGDLPDALIDALDAALAPDADDRPPLEELAAALADARARVADDGESTIARTLELGVGRPRGGRAVPRSLARAAAGALSGALLALALHAAASSSPHAPASSIGAVAPAALVLTGLVCAVAVALLPRLGWIAAALAAVALLAPDRGGTALLVAVAALPVPLLLRRWPLAWSLPALAPLLGALGLAGGFPALAFALRSWRARAALGALGAWWLLLAQALGQRHRAGFVGADVDAAAHGAGQSLAALVSGAALGYLAVWALAAAVAPWLVRGRSLALDVIAAALWAGALVGATGAVARALGLAPPPHVAVAALAGAALCLAARAGGWRLASGPDTVVPHHGRDG